MERKIQKKFIVFQIIVSELGDADTHNLEQDTCHRQSMCWQKPLTFYLTLGETFSKSTSLRMIKKTWQKCSHGNSRSICDAFTCSLSKRVLKRRFLESGLTKIFTVCNFANTLTVTIMFFSKCLKFDVDSGNGTKNQQKVYRFSDNCIWIGSCRFSQDWTGYLPSTGNVLTNTSNISPNTRGDIFQINFTENDKKTW